MLVKYFAMIRKLAGCSQQWLAEPAPTIGALLSRLAEQHGGDFRRTVFDGEQLSSSIIVMVNGQSVAHLGGLATPLGPDDVVAVFPMVAGG